MAILAGQMKRKPLTVSAVEKWILKHKDRIISQLGLNDWSIVIKVSKGADCSINRYTYDYKQSTITISTLGAWSYEHLEQTLRHELCHLLVSPLTELENKLLPLITPKARKTALLLLNSANEQITENMVLIQRLNGICPPLKEECYYSKAAKQ